MKLVDSSTERSTAATDVLLALVGIGAAVYLQGAGGGESWRAAVWTWVFAMVAFSGVLGALAHGLGAPPGLHAGLWQGINLGLGLALSLFVVGVLYDVAGPAAARRMLKPMLAAGVAFYLLMRLWPGSFVVFILCQAAASIFALAVYAYLAVSARLPGAGLLATGILVNLCAAFIQIRKRWHLRAIWEFDHNGLFHLVQAAGMLLILAGLKKSL
jgi:hypothetical protein